MDANETAAFLELMDFLKTTSFFFLVVVMPTWIVFHYRSKQKQAAVLTDEEQTALDALTRVADKIEARLETLEKILDVEHPNWKEKQP